MDYTKRFLSFLIDEIIFSVMSIVLMLIFSHIGILKENFNFSIIGPIIFWSLFIFKDLKGKSFGKSIFKLQIVDCQTKKTASPLKCVLRNLFYILGIFDLIFMCYHSQGRRLGDYIVGTKVIKL